MGGRRNSPRRDQSKYKPGPNLKKTTQKNKEKEHNPWAPKPIRLMEPQSQDFITLEGNLLYKDFVATNIEIDIRESLSHHCQLYIYNTPYSQEETLERLNNAASHIIHKLIRFSTEDHCYVVECTLA